MMTMSNDVAQSDSPISGIRAVGTDALLIEARTHDDVPAICAAITAHLRAPGDSWQTADVIPAARTVLLTGLTHELSTVAHEIRTWLIPALPPNAGPLVTLPVVFDGSDLGDVARAWNTTADAVVSRLRDIEFRVAFSGFAPGFGYLTGLPDGAEVPRRDTPRTRVPAGSVGLAGRYCGIYPRESPGGWQLVGRVVEPGSASTSAEPRLGSSARTALWDLERDPPALLTPGTRVRFSDG